MYIFEKIGVNLNLDFVALLIFVIEIFLILLPLISIIIFIKKVKKKLFYSPILILILLAEGALFFAAGLFSMSLQGGKRCPVVVSGYSLDDLRQPDVLKKYKYKRDIWCGRGIDLFYKKVEIKEYAILENNIDKAVSAILKADFYDDVLIKIFTTPPSLFANGKPVVLIDYKKSDDSILITIITTHKTITTTHKRRINE